MQDLSLTGLSTNDRFGFYQVGQFKTYSKMEAIELHRRTGHHPHWNFNEEVFSCYDWTAEPQESLWELYTKRAKQLREKYEYLVLGFSCGADSHMMARVFLENQIPFEEMITGYVGYDDADEFSNVEQFAHALPQVRQWQQTHDFQHRMIDWAPYITEAFFDPDLVQNWAYYFNNNLGLTRLGLSYLREKDPHYRELLAQGRQVCFVWALEKPRIYIVDGRYCIRFLDYFDSIIPARTQILDRPEEINECFYSSPDAVPLMIKQGHEIMKFFKRQQGVSDEFFSDSDYFKDRTFRHLLPEDIWTCGNDWGNANTSIKSNAELIHHIIYPGHRPTGLPKQRYGLGIMTSRADRVYHQHSDYRRRLTMAIEKWRSIDPYWLNQDTGDVKGCISPPYFLEKPKS